MDSKIEITHIQRENSKAEESKRRIDMLWKEFDDTWRHDYQYAFKILDTIIDLQKTSDSILKAWYEKGRLLERLGKSHEAIDCYNKAMSINPIVSLEECSIIYIKKLACTFNACLLQKEKRYEEAIRAYDMAIGLVYSRNMNHLSKKEKEEELLRIKGEQIGYIYNKILLLERLSRQRQILQAYNEILNYGKYASRDLRKHAKRRKKQIKKFLRTGKR